MSNISYDRVIYDHELTLYPYAPLGILHNKGEWPEARYKFSIIATASANDQNIEEWIVYHQNIGVDHIYLYCVDEDPTILYRRIIPFIINNDPFITFHHFRFSKIKTPISFHFMHNHIHETSWFISLNINDFFFIHKRHTISDFLQSFASINVNAIYFNIFMYEQIENLTADTIEAQFKESRPTNQPCITTKILIKSRACPYQSIFKILHVSIDQHINDENLTPHSYNVLQESMENYFIKYPTSALDFINTEKEKKILETAYIAKFTNTKHDKSIPEKPFELQVSNHSINTTYFYHISISQFWDKIINSVWQHSLTPATLPSIVDISRNKYCKQSSAPNVFQSDQLANILVNGTLHGTTQSITKKENNPWWEIDLLESHIVKIIYLFNGLDLNNKNMSSFCIQTSEDHQSWIDRHHKRNSTSFGGSDGSFYKWMHPLGVRARWVRIILIGHNQSFSLDQIRIYGLEYTKFLTN